jgi:hypothetical protein
MIKQPKKDLIMEVVKKAEKNKIIKPEETD